MKPRVCRVLFALMFAVGAAHARGAVSAPEGFPTFSAPGQDAAMRNARDLYALHWPNATPRPTLWDEWLLPAAVWPAVSDVAAPDMRALWRAALSGRRQDVDGTIATHQHASITHTFGWPFPMWTAGEGGWGWHFSFKNTVTPPFRPGTLNTPEDWATEGIENLGVDDDGWRMRLAAPNASITTPLKVIDTFQAPLVQVRWMADGYEGANPYIEWATEADPAFGPERRVYCSPPSPQTADPASNMTYTIVPMHTMERWRGRITHLRLGFGNPRPGGTVWVQALMTHYDSRHNVNNPSFLNAAASYFHWTGDLPFLRANIGRMRLALRNLMTEHHGLSENIIRTDWPGHDGRSALQRHPDGTKTILYGHGVGNNYWDLMPFGWKDAYATIRYYDALNVMARLERDIRDHPEWAIPGGPLALDPDFLLRHAAKVKSAGNKTFWNPKTGRFVACVDADGAPHDYGYTFVNLEAIHYGFATDRHAKAIMDWMTGRRIVDGDTAQGADIYRWRFAPRSSTARNTDWYTFVWKEPENIPWGDQVQDGGAVLGFSYHDIMARLKTEGPDDAWRRFSEVMDWFGEVQAAGGYRQYYDGSRPGKLQGGGTPGGLGVDVEFYESVLVPQAVLFGFMGFAPTADGFRVEPRLPGAIPRLTVNRIRWRDLILSVTADSAGIEIAKQGRCDGPAWIHLPRGAWSAAYNTGGSFGPYGPVRRRADGAARLEWERADAVRLRRTERNGGDGS